MLCKHAAEAGTLKLKPAHQDSTGAHKQSRGTTLSGLGYRQLSQAKPSRAVGIPSPFLSLLDQGRTNIAIGRPLDRARFYDLVWPAGATLAMISNDGGFVLAGQSETVPLSPTVPLTLEPYGNDILPKTV